MELSNVRYYCCSSPPPLYRATKSISRNALDIHPMQLCGIKYLSSDWRSDLKRKSSRLSAAAGGWLSHEHSTWSWLYRDLRFVVARRLLFKCSVFVSLGAGNCLASLFLASSARLSSSHLETPSSSCLDKN